MRWSIKRGIAVGGLIGFAWQFAIGLTGEASLIAAMARGCGGALVAGALGALAVMIRNKFTTN